MDDHPKVQEDIHNSIGKPLEMNLGPDFSAVQKGREQHAHYLNADLADGPKLTELCTPIFDAWPQAAHDPDRPLIDWLRTGAPGVSENTQNTQGFPWLPRRSPRMHLNSHLVMATTRTTPAWTIALMVMR